MTPLQNIVSDACICGDSNCDVPYGYCHCLCGNKTRMASKTMTSRGWVKGKPIRFINRHVKLIGDGLSNQERYRRRLISVGICSSCAKNKTDGRILCENCRLKVLESRVLKTDPRRRRGVRSKELTCRECPALADRGSVFCRKHRTIDCTQCGKSFTQEAGSQRKFCSVKCRSLKQSTNRGSMAHNWRGGRKSLSVLERGRIEYKEWRKAVFERDNWTCQVCKKRGGAIEAHHIKEFAKHPSLRTQLINGQTLCTICHKKIHRERISKNASKRIAARKVKQYRLGFVR